MNLKCRLILEDYRKQREDFIALGDTVHSMLLSLVNELDIGPQGFGGNTTALAVNIETAPTHIAGLPVAVNMQCHAARHKTATI